MEQLAGSNVQLLAREATAPVKLEAVVAQFLRVVKIDT